MRSLKVIGIVTVLAALGIVVGARGAAQNSAGLPEEPGFLVTAEVAALERDGLEPAAAYREIEFQGAVDRARLIEKIERGLGSRFSGAWFAPAAAELRVGVISAADRHRVEALAASAGLESGVVPVAVDSTWAQLETTQEAWNQKLGDLFRSRQVSTSLDPQANAVEIKLASTVSDDRRADLERQARSAEPAVRIQVSGIPRIGASPAASRCKQFNAGEGYCNSPIVAGMSIESASGTRCTAGPAVLTKDPKEDTTETFILTAGHCLNKSGDREETWFAFDKAGNKKLLGKGVEEMSAANDDKVDVGTIKVEGNNWSNNGQTPVNPTIVRWEGNEPEPFALTGKLAPVVNHMSCYSGQSSGTDCGTISAIQETIVVGGNDLKEMVEVHGLTKQIDDGDSGGPFYSKATPGNPSLAEGVTFGVVTGTKFGLFEPLDYDFATLALGTREPMELKLLTTTNETRPKCPMPGMKCFEAESYPATLTGSQVGTQKFGVESGNIECGTASFSATLAEGVETFETSPSYGSCSFTLAAVTPDVNGCKYKFAPTSNLEADKYKGTVDIVCPSEKSIALTSACGCTVTIGSQSALGTVEYVDTTAASPKKDVDVKLSISGLKYTESSGCKHPGTRSTGTYSGEMTVKADTGGGSAQGVWVSG
jgi:hypothetical protein